MESMVRVAMVPSSFRVTTAITSDWKPRAVPTRATSGRGSAIVSSAGSSAGNSLFSASMTPLEEKVAPVTMSTPSPTTNGPFLPMNWLMKESTRMLLQTGGTSPLTSISRVAMVPSSFRVTFTTTPSPKPSPLAVRVSTAGASSTGSAGNSLFSASMTPLEEKVAPVTMSTPSPTTNGPFLPMNWLMKESTRMLLQTGGTSPLTSISSVAMVPSSFRVTFTTTPSPKPSLLAVRVSTAGISASAGNRLLMAAMAPLEEKVAPVATSMPSPTTNGPFLPMNCLMKLSASTRSQAGGSSLLTSISRVAMVPSAVRPTVTTT